MITLELRHCFHLAGDNFSISRLLWKETLLTKWQRGTRVTREVARVMQRAREKIQAGGEKNICWIQTLGSGVALGRVLGKCKSPGNPKDSLVTRPAIKG